MIVVDASVMAPALGDDGIDGGRARSRLGGETLAAPELIDLEVASVLRQLTLTGHLAGRRAELALSDLVAMPPGEVRRPLGPGTWTRCEVEVLGRSPRTGAAGP